MKSKLLCIAAFASCVSSATEYLWSVNEADNANVISNACHFPVDINDILPTT